MPSLTADNPLPAYYDAQGKISKRSETARKKLGVTPITQCFGKVAVVAGPSLLKL
jgi:hypothetical protein